MFFDAALWAREKHLTVAAKFTDSVEKCSPQAVHPSQYSGSSVLRQPALDPAER
jgi:hypothetical protein